MAIPFLSAQIALLPVAAQPTPLHLPVQTAETGLEPELECAYFAPCGYALPAAWMFSKETGTHGAEQSCFL
jgi:hypothetical protein